MKYNLNTKSLKKEKKTKLKFHWQISVSILEYAYMQVDLRLLRHTFPGIGHGTLDLFWSGLCVWSQILPDSPWRFPFVWPSEKNGTKDFCGDQETF